MSKYTPGHISFLASILLLLLLFCLVGWLAGCFDIVGVMVFVSLGGVFKCAKLKNDHHLH